MSDIFISYAREDEPHAKRLATALTDNGWSVWWDRDIPTGKNFDQVIEEQLRAARCIVVIWSARSVASQWVRAEALYAFERHTLVPVRIDATEVPFVFRQVQTADLTGWNGDATHPALAPLRSSIASLIAGDGDAPRVNNPIPARSRSVRSILAARRGYVAVVSSGLATVAVAAWFFSASTSTSAEYRSRESAGTAASAVESPARKGPSPTATPVPVAPTRTRILPPPEATVVF